MKYYGVLAGEHSGPGYVAGEETEAEAVRRRKNKPAGLRISARSRKTGEATDHRLKLVGGKSRVRRGGGRGAANCARKRPSITNRRKEMNKAQLR